MHEENRRKEERILKRVSDSDVLSLFGAARKAAGTSVEMRKSNELISCEEIPRGKRSS